MTVTHVGAEPNIKNYIIILHKQSEATDMVFANYTAEYDVTEKQHYHLRSLTKLKMHTVLLSITNKFFVNGTEIIHNV